jgi:hypothetical protein
MKNKGAPVHEIRRGFIKVKIRSKRGDKRKHYSLSIVRLFRNGDQWKESSRYGRDDIPVIRLALDEAFGWILVQQELAQCDTGKAATE